ncbi:MAG: hypothetical protein ACHQD9_07995 [Chitinophagales bacterium]
MILIEIVFCTSLLLAQQSSSDQQDVKKIKGNHYLSLSPTLTFVHYKDYVNSPLTYNTIGVPLGLEISYENRSQNHSGYSKIFFTNEALNTKVAPSVANPSESFLTVQFNTSRCWNLASLWNDRIHYRLGYAGSFDYNHQINLRLENAAYTFAIFANGGVANRFEFPFIVKTEKNFWFIHFNNPQQHFLLSWQLNVPIIGAITRPNFAGIRHFANGEFTSNLFREMGTHLQVASLNNFFMLNSQFELWAPLGNNNKLKLAYQWEGFSYYGNYVHVQSTMWSIMIGVMFKIDGRPEVDHTLK